MRKFIALQLVIALAIGSICLSSCAIPVPVVQPALGGGTPAARGRGRRGLVVWPKPASGGKTRA